MAYGELENDDESMDFLRFSASSRFPPVDQVLLHPEISSTALRDIYPKYPILVSATCMCIYTILYILYIHIMIIMLHNGDQ